MTFGYGENHDGEQLAGVSLAGQMLIESSFLRANLDGADLFGADAGGTIFDEASLQNANLSKANLRGSRFCKARAASASFARADLVESTFEGADLTSARFAGAYLMDVTFARANLRGADFSNAKLGRTDFRGADLTDASFNEALFDRSVRLEGCVGLSSVELTMIRIGAAEVTGDAARTWLQERATPIAVTREQLESYYADRLAGRDGPPEVARIFDPPAHAIDFERVLGAPVATSPVDATGSFYGSTRNEYVLSRWPTLRFGVNADTDGGGWNLGFTGGDLTVPIAPYAWTLGGLREAGIVLEDDEEWGYDLDAVVVIDGTRRRAKFRYGVLVELD